MPQSGPSEGGPSRSTILGSPHHQAGRQRQGLPCSCGLPWVGPHFRIYNKKASAACLRMRSIQRSRRTGMTRPAPLS